MKSRPGTTTAALALAAALVLQLAAPAAAACQSATMGACTPSATPQGDCCAGKTCHPVIKQCYPAPRAAGQPCLGARGRSFRGMGCAGYWYAALFGGCQASIRRGACGEVPANALIAQVAWCLTGLHDLATLLLATNARSSCRCR